jgi:hypothetical protein
LTKNLGLDKKKVHAKNLTTKEKYDKISNLKSKLAEDIANLKNHASQNNGTDTMKIRIDCK